MPHWPPESKPVPFPAANHTSLKNTPGMQVGPGRDRTRGHKVTTWTQVPTMSWVLTDPGRSVGWAGKNPFEDGSGHLQSHTSKGRGHSKGHSWWPRSLPHPPAQFRSSYLGPSWEFCMTTGRRKKKSNLSSWSGRPETDR